MPRTHSHNESLDVFEIPGFGTEDVLVDDLGRVITGTEDGVIWRLEPKTGQSEKLGETGGRPLGLEFLDQTQLLICDAKRGLLALDLDTSSITVLADSAGGRPFKFCNNAAVARDQTIYFSDSSRFYGIAQWRWDVAENTRSGRLLRRTPDGEIDVLVDGLAFANGVALSADESYVVVAESTGRTLIRRWLTGPKAGLTDVFAENLPGYLDNISLGTDGLIWVCIASPVNPTLTFLYRHAPKPVRAIAGRLPESIGPKVARTARVLAFDAEGIVVHDRQLDHSAFHMITGLRERDGVVWLGSLHEGTVASFAVHE